MILSLRGRVERVGLLVIVAALCSCNAAAPASQSPSASGAGSPRGVSASPAPSLGTPTAARATLAECGAPRDLAALHVVHRFSVSPDDITVDGAGRLWVSALQADLLLELEADGTVVTSQTVTGGPEGVAADGTTLYVAQQQLNAIATVGPPVRQLVTLPMRAGQEGVDGIAWDAARNELLLPDSPTGQLFALRPAATTPTLLADGLGRPVAATTDPAGNVFVASETAPGLTELAATGARTAVGRFADLDEVLWYAGLLYVTELDRRDVVAVDPASGESRAVAVNLPSPQGLAVTASGTLEIVDATTDTLYSMPACGVAS